MKKINKSRIKIKNLLGIVDNPTYEDLLFEIVSFLENEHRIGEEAEFKKWEVSQKTRCRIGNEIVNDLDKLIEMKYLEKGKYSTYKVLKHPW